MGLTIKRGQVGRAVFPPEQVAEVKVIARASCRAPTSWRSRASRGLGCTAW